VHLAWTRRLSIYYRRIVISIHENSVHLASLVEWMTQRHEVRDGFESGCTYQIQKLVISYSQLLAKQSLHQHAKKINIEDYSGECRQDSGSKLWPLHPEGLSSANSATCARCLLQITEIWILRWFVPLSLFNFTAVQMNEMEQTRSNRVLHKIR